MLKLNCRAPVAVHIQTMVCSIRNTNTINMSGTAVDNVLTVQAHGFLCKVLKPMQNLNLFFSDRTINGHLQLIDKGI